MIQNVKIQPLPHVFVLSQRIFLWIIHLKYPTLVTENTIAQYNTMTLRILLWTCLQHRVNAAQIIFFTLGLGRLMNVYLVSILSIQCTAFQHIYLVHQNTNYFIAFWI